jgi:hypothetical protein
MERGDFYSEREVTSGGTGWEVFCRHSFGTLQASKVNRRMQSFYFFAGSTLGKSPDRFTISVEKIFDARNGGTKKFFRFRASTTQTFFAKAAAPRKKAIPLAIRELANGFPHCRN